MSVSAENWLLSVGVVAAVLAVALALHMRNLVKTGARQQVRAELLAARISLASLRGTSGVVYTDHSARQMAELGINEEHVETVLTLPMAVVHPLAGTTVQFERPLGSRILKVHVANPTTASYAALVVHVEWRAVRKVRPALRRALLTRWAPMKGVASSIRVSK